MNTRLGKIQKIHFGMGGYQDAMIGITFVLGGAGWGVMDFWGDWASKHRPDMQWTEESRLIRLGEMVMKINELLQQAKKTSIEQLKDVPIEATFESNTLKSWRILEEVL